MGFLSEYEINIVFNQKNDDILRRNRNIMVWSRGEVSEEFSFKFVQFEIEFQGFLKLFIGVMFIRRIYGNQIYRNSCI